jgi:hypothetical protein
MLQMSFFRNPRFSAASVSIMLVFFAMFGLIFRAGGRLGHGRGDPPQADG